MFVWQDDEFSPYLHQHAIEQWKLCFERIIALTIEDFIPLENG